MAGHTGFNLLREYPDYTKRWIGSAVSALGTQVGWIALIWLAMRVSGGAAAIGTVTLLYLFPQVLVGPIAGTVLDRFSRARLMAAANFVLAAIFAAIPLVTIGRGQWHSLMMYGLILLAGLVLPFDTVGSGPLVADIIPSDKLSEANFLSQVIWQVAFLVGPGLGGLLVALTGSRILLLGDAATFMVLAVLMLTIRTGHLGGGIPTAALWREAGAGLQFLVRTPALLTLAVFTLLFNFFYGPFEVLLPDLARLHFGGPAALGLLWFCFSAGALGGALWFSSKQWPFKMAQSFAVIIIVWGVCAATFAWAGRDLWAACAVLLAGGLVYSPWEALAVTAVQRLVPRHMQGRAFGASNVVAAGGMPLGAWLTGISLPLINPRLVFLVCGLVTIGVGMAAFGSRSLREFDRPRPDESAAPPRAGARPD